MAMTKERITILVSKEFFDEFKRACEEGKTTMSAVIRPSAERFTKRWKAKQAKPVPPT